MFLELAHTKLPIYLATSTLVTECYKLTQQFPSEEKFSLIPQIRRASISVHLNISEGASRKSANERKRYYEIARGSLVEIDAALDISEKLNYCNKENLKELGTHIVHCFKQITGLINSTKTS